MFCSALFPSLSVGQPHFFKGDEDFVKNNYRRTDTLIPMRDGTGLYTVIYTPKNAGTYPILINRTPYGIGPYDRTKMKPRLGPSFDFTREQFIFVYQDVRGTGLSEGVFTHVKPIGTEGADEATDFYDTAEWLLQQAALRHNGKIGVWGLSYGGFYTLCAVASGHPALALAAPEAPVTNWGRGDDFVQNGIFYFAHAFGFFSWFNRLRNDALPTANAHRHFEFPENTSAYDFYLRAGTAQEAGEKYLPDVPFWDTLLHNKSREFWDLRDPLFKIKSTGTAILITGGWFDFENISGTCRAGLLFDTLCEPGKFTWVMGPWTHGAWWTGKGDSAAGPMWSNYSAAKFRAEIQLPFFVKHLKNKPGPPLPRFVFYRTGSARFEYSDTLATGTEQVYYLNTGALSLSPEKSKYRRAAEACMVQNNKLPAPYSTSTSQEIDENFIFENQQFMNNRPDEVRFYTTKLTSPITFTGTIELNLTVAAENPNFDVIVKLLDCVGDDCHSLALSAARHITAHDDKITLTLPPVHHEWKKGHRMALQFQTSCFPLLELNPDAPAVNRICLKGGKMNLIPLKK